MPDSLLSGLIELGLSGRLLLLRFFLREFFGFFNYLFCGCSIFIFLRNNVSRPVWRIFIGIAGYKLAAKPAENIVNKTLGEGDISIGSHSGRLESSMTEFIHKSNKRHAILQVPLKYMFL